MRNTILLAVLAFAGHGYGADFWVDPASTSATPDGSENAPFAEIADALARATGPGDTVILRAGVYRQRLTTLPSGEAEKPFTLKAAPGQRVVISGAQPIEGWQKQPDGTYTATVKTRPAALKLNGRDLPIAREPNDGWWVATAVTDTTITDAANLRSLATDPAGAAAYIWTQTGNNFSERKIESLDRASATITLAPPDRRALGLSANDKYYLRNHPAFIDRPGEWAVTEAGPGQYTVHYRPADEADLAAVEVPVVEGSVLAINGRRHIVLDGLEITGGVRNGLEISKSSDIAVSNCVIHNNGYAGLWVRDAQNIHVRRCISLRNEYGMTFHTVKHAVVEESEIAHNGTDGLIFSWNSENVTLRRSHVHDHQLWGHPDNVQMYRNVSNFKLIDNLLQTAGQTLMTEEVTGGEIAGNMFVGSGANMLIFGHKNAGDITIRNNTFAFAGYQAMSLTFKDYRVHDNIFVTGHPKPAFGIRGVENYSGDRNLFWNTERLTGSATVLASDAGFHRSLEAFQTATGQDANSAYADPRFRNAPVGFAVLDGKRLSDCTAATLHLRGGGALFKAGDHIEINFDGIRRRVTEASAESITIDPPLPERPTKSWLVANWGTSADFALDLRLKPNSPAHTLGEDGAPIGSTIDIQAYHNGDFDADGTRDLPPLPPELQN